VSHVPCDRLVILLSSDFNSHTSAGLLPLPRLSAATGAKHTPHGGCRASLSAAPTPAVGTATCRTGAARGCTHLHLLSLHLSLMQTRKHTHTLTHTRTHTHTHTHTAAAGWLEPRLPKAVADHIRSFLGDEHRSTCLLFCLTCNTSCHTCNNVYVICGAEYRTCSTSIF
jgi:hypothetical protein